MNLHYEPINGSSWLWIKKNVPCLAVEDSCGIVAVNNAQNYVGACVMDTWTGNAVTCTFVIDNRFVLRGGFLNMVCSYIFEERGVQIAYVQVADNNLKSLKFVKHIGFKEVARLKDTFKDGVGCVILELTKDKCNYLLEEVA